MTEKNPRIKKISIEGELDFMDVIKSKFKLSGKKLIIEFENESAANYFFQEIQNWKTYPTYPWSWITINDDKLFGSDKIPADNKGYPYIITSPNTGGPIVIPTTTIIGDNINSDISARNERHVYYDVTDPDNEDKPFFRGENIEQYP